AGAVTARNIVRLPGPERDLVDVAVAGDGQRGIPEGDFLLLELRGDGPERGLAGRHPPVIFGTGQAKIQLKRVRGLSWLSERQDGTEHTEAKLHKAKTFQKTKMFQAVSEVVHGLDPRKAGR